MTRRAASALARLLPALLVAGALLLVAAAGLAACGGPSGGSPTPTATAATASPSSAPSAAATPDAQPIAYSLYFVRDGKLGTASRTFAGTKPDATAALKALLEGPEAAEQAAGLTTDIPAKTRLNSVSVSAGTASVDLSAGFASPAGEAVAARRVAEVVYTLTQFATIKRVTFTVAGDPLTEIPSAKSAEAPAVTLHGPQRRGAPWASFEPDIFAERPGVGAVLSSPFVLAGTARVFEGSFTARLLDSSGRRIVNLTLQATRGAPRRGHFRKVVAFSTSATEGTLVLYSESMEDGSRLNVVRIPVTFTR